MNSRLLDYARRGEIVVMAGAGVSAGKPTALPGWKPLNRAIAHALRRRLESAIGRPGWLEQVVSLLDAERDADRFPPEYQAQLIEEMCGDRYFEALQALDIKVINRGHEGIAALAAAGALKAVVTTNFDRLIEHAVEGRGEKCVVAFDDGGFIDMGRRLHAGGRAPLPVIKIHGCVSDHKSMIDTLKQRRRGRARYLQDCLEPLHSGYWLYLGFSADDLDGNPDYLGLVAGAVRSAGATYVSYPKNPDLGRGAQRLMNAFGDRGSSVKEYVDEFLAEACGALGTPGPAAIPGEVALGQTVFEQRLQAWADALAPAAAGLCLAALLEAVGQGEAAVRVLDRLVRKEFYDQRNTADFRALQLHYGRLAAAWGRFIAVPDLNGAASNASVEAPQSLARLLQTDAGFAASSWLACLWLWLNKGSSATGLAVPMMDGLASNQWKGPAPRSHEEAVDAWLSAVQVMVVNAHPVLLGLVADTVQAALARARDCGDVVRTARVASLNLLAMAETTQDLPALSEQHREDFAEAARVGDRFASGMRSLALGRWHVGAGGLALGQGTDPVAVARRGLDYLRQAVASFEQQGLDPWALFALIQQAKAHADLRQFDEAQACLDQVAPGLRRFPVFTSHTLEAMGQIRAMYDSAQAQAEAQKSFRAAVQAAEQSGLLARREQLLRYVRP
jgi:tetratricopeptide (TPR) repeat protein